MTALLVIGLIVLVIALILLIRVGCRVDYSAEGFFLDLKVGCLRFRLVPAKDDPRKAAKQERKRAKQEQKKKRKTEEQKGQTEQEKPKRKLGDLLWLVELIRPVLHALSQLRRKLRIELISVDYALGGAKDPAKAAVQYGIVSAGGGALFPLINAAFDVRDWEVDLGVDFQSEQSMVAVTATGSYRIGQLLGIALSLGFRALSIFVKQKQGQPKQGGTKHGREASNR